MTELASANVVLEPTVSSTFGRQAQQAGQQGGQQFGDSFNRSAERGTSGSLGGSFASEARTNGARAGDSAGQAFGSRFSSRVQEAGRRGARALGTTLAAGTVAATAFLGSAINGGAQLEQSIGAIQTIFKTSANEMLTFSKTAATTVGLSSNEFNELGTLIGGQLKNGGTAMDQLVPKTTKLVKLGADLASVYGGSTKEAVEALSSALKGERDPIERFNVQLNQAKIDAEAAALGYKKVGGSFDSTAQQAATLSLIFKQSKDAQGNFGRESDTLAHKQQVLGAKFKDLRDRIGLKLIPVVLKLMEVFQQKIVPVFNQVVAAVRPVVQAIGERLAPIFSKVNGFLKENPEIVKGAAIGLGILAVALGVVALAMGAVAIASSPITAVVLGVMALGAGIAYAMKNSATFRGIVAQVGAVLARFGTYLKTVVLPAVIALAQKVATNLKPVLTALGQFFTGTLVPILKAIVAKFRELWPTIQRVIGVVAGLYAKFVLIVSWIAGKVIPIVLKVAGFLARVLVAAVLAAVGVIVRIIGFFASLVTGIGRAIGKIGEFAKKVGSKIGEVVGFVKDLPGRITRALGDVGKMLFESGKKIIGGLIDGLKKKAEDIGGAVKNIAGKITDFFPMSPVKKGPLRAFNGGKTGKKLMGMLAAGLDGGAPGVLAAITRVTARIDKLTSAKKFSKKSAANLKALIAPVTAQATKLQNLVAARNDLAGQISGNLRGEFNLSELTATNEFGLSQGSGVAAQAAQALVSRMKAFAGKLTALLKAGLPAALVQEVAGYGSVEGSRVADVLLSGPASNVKAIAAAANGFQKYANSAGAIVANATYGRQIDQAEARLESAVTRAMSRAQFAVTVGIDKRTSVKIYSDGKSQSEKRK